MIFHFDRYTLDKDRLELRRGEEAIDLEPQVFSVLTYLVENPGSGRQQGGTDRRRLGRPHRFGLCFEFSNQFSQTRGG